MFDKNTSEQSLNFRLNVNIYLCLVRQITNNESVVSCTQLLFVYLVILEINVDSH